MDIVLNFIGEFIYYTWWAWAFFLILPFAADSWETWRQVLFEHAQRWTMLEIHMPRENKKGPRGMEQIFTHLWSLKNSAGNIRERWWDGELTRWHSFEIVAMEGEIHFYVRTPKTYAPIIKANFYSYYPDVEVTECEDWTKKLPKDVQGLYMTGRRMWGTELMLDKHPAFPIRWYTDFESPAEELQFDPISNVLEVFGRLEKDQIVAFEIIAAPADNSHEVHEVASFQEVELKLRDRLYETGGGHGGGHAKPTTKAKFEGLLPVFETQSHEPVDDLGGKLQKAIMSRTPGEMDILKRVEENLAQPFFTVMMRFMYISPFESYSEDYGRRSVFASLNQYQAHDVNRFKRNDKVETRAKLFESPYIFPDTRKEYRRQRIYHDMIHRERPPHTFMGRLLFSHPLNWYFKTKYVYLTPRSLASVFHPPQGMVLTAPHLRRVDSRKAAPPAGLAIFGEESGLDRFN